MEKLGTEYTIKANLNGLSNEHGTVHILSNPEEFPDNREQPDASPNQLNPAPRPAPRRVAAEQPEVEDGGTAYLGYTSNEVDFATDDKKTARLNDGGTVNVLGGDNIHTASSSTKNDNGQTVDNIHIHLDKDIRVDSVSIGEKGPILNGKGMDMKGLSITGLAPGEVSATSTDAVNGSQLYATNQMVQENRQNITQLGNSLNKLDNRINRVGAGAALWQRSIRWTSTRTISGISQPVTVTTAVPMRQLLDSTIGLMKTLCSASAAASAAVKT